MSLAHRFDHVEHIGFGGQVRVLDARRQFAVSLAMVIILAISAAVLGVSTKLSAPAGGDQPVAERAAVL